MIDSLGCGGAERSLINLLSLLDYSKVDVTLMLVARDGVFERYVPKHVNVVSYTPGCGTMLQKTWLFICRMAFSLQLLLNRFRRHPLNSPTLEWKTCCTAIQAHRIYYDVAIAYQQGFPCWYILDKVSAARKYAWINVDITKTKFRLDYIKRFYSRYDGVVAVSDALHDILLEIGLVDKEHLHCIHDILNPVLIRRQGDESFVGECPCRDAATIVTVARLNARHKGQDLCLEAARILKSKGYRFRWFFVGDGPDRCFLERQAQNLNVEDKIRFVGMQANPYPYMKAADVYVQSSRFEGFGLTVTEAKILGCAIVCTDFPTAFSQLEDGKDGLIVEMAAQSMADGIERLLTDKVLVKKIQSAASQELNTTAMTEVRKVMDLIMA